MLYIKIGFCKFGNFKRMSNPYLQRLWFLDKIGYDRAFVEFKHTAHLMDEDERAFLKSLMDSGLEYEPTSIKNALNFIDSFVDVGKYPDQAILTRCLFLSILDSQFVNKFALITTKINVKGWIFHALAKIISHRFEILTDSIKNDHPIWEYMIPELEHNAKSLEFDPKKRFCEREGSTLIEVFPLYWPFEKSSKVEVEKLVKQFSDFCLEVRSRTAFNLLSVLAYVFPVEIYKGISENIIYLKHYAVVQILKSNQNIDLTEFETEDVKQLVITMVQFNSTEALRLAKTLSDSEDLVEMINHYTAADHSFV